MTTASRSAPWTAALNSTAEPSSAFLNELGQAGCEIQSWASPAGTDASAAVAEPRSTEVPDALINVLSASSGDPLESAATERIEEFVNRNLTHLLVTCQNFGRAMLQRGSGVIVTVLVGDEADALSMVTDRAATGLMRVFGVEWAAQGVRTVTVSPAGIPGPERDEAVARAVAYLASDGASFVTASELVVGG